MPRIDGIKKKPRIIELEIVKIRKQMYIYVSGHFGGENLSWELQERGRKAYEKVRVGDADPEGRFNPFLDDEPASEVDSGSFLLLKDLPLHS
jgi:hypothetical protein